MTPKQYRRVVTGLNAHGQSCVVIDGPVPPDETSTSLVWRTASVPADNSGTDDTWTPFNRALLSDPGSKFILVQMQPGKSEQLFMHATNTIDYLIVLEGEIMLVLETSEVRLGPGDLVVDRGVIHGWRNVGAGPVTFVSIMIESEPVGPGATV